MIRRLNLDIDREDAQKFNGGTKRTVKESLNLDFIPVGVCNKDFRTRSLDVQRRI